MSDAHLLAELSLALGEEQRRATYACGGTIPIDMNPNSRTQSKVVRQLITTKPVTMRFGPNGTGQTLTLPINTEQDPAFLALLNISQPAQFGLNGHDVYDEESDLPFAFKGIDMALYESVRAAGLSFNLFQSPTTTCRTTTCLTTTVLMTTVLMTIRLILTSLRKNLINKISFRT